MAGTHGGYRPGAGRKKATVKAMQATVTDRSLASPSSPPKKPVVLPIADDTFGASTPMRLLALVAQGATHTDDGTEITPAMVSAAKEILPFFESKRATTQEKRGPQKPLEELSDAELRQLIEDDTNRIAALLAEAEGRSHGTLRPEDGPV